MEERERDPRQRQRAEGMCVGLRNIGNTCYVNSLLQTYFLLPTLRDTVLAANANEILFVEHKCPEIENTDDPELKKALAMSMGMEITDGDGTDKQESAEATGDESR